MRTPQPLQRGFAAIAAVFLLVVLAALGAYMVSVSNTQQLNSAQDLQGSRAYWAARAGLEWGIASLPPGSTACWASVPPAAIEGFTLAVSCTMSSYTEGTATVYIFRVTSRASTGAVGTVGFVEREVAASLER